MISLQDIERGLSRILVGLGGRTGSAQSSSPAAMILVAPGSGNIGDQAMFESAMQNVEEPVIVVTGSGDAISSVPDLGKAFEEVELPQLMYGHGISRLFDSFRFGRLLRSSSRLYIVGADMMDGSYGDNAAITRWSLATAAAGFGVTTTILGCSWRSTTSARVRRAGKAALASGVNVCLRDRDSFSRAIDQGLDNVILTSDVVFAHRQMGSTSMYLEDLQDAQRDGLRIVTVNVSGLIAEKYDQEPEYVAIIEKLLNLGCHVVLLPHVISKERGDLAAQTSLLRLIDSARNVTVVSEQLSPSQIREICKVSKFVITGRMHLSILALTESTPAIVFTTNDKVSGLLTEVGLPNLCIEPATGCHQAVFDAMTYLENMNGGELSAVVRNIDEVRKRSFLNFGL